MSTFPRRIVILGSGGFIGGRLLKNFSMRSNLQVNGYSSNDCDLLSADHTERALSDLTTKDVLIVTSAVSRLKENSFDSMMKNIRMVENISGSVAKHPAGQLIFLSTVDVYGVNIGKNTKISEESRLDPNDYYAVSKIVGEFLLRRMCGKMNVPLTILRLSGVFGPGDDGKSTINAFILSALQKRKICIYGKGDDLRDYIYVDDLYSIINASIEKRLNKTVNVATGKSYSIIEIVRIIKSLLPYELQIDFKPKPDNVEKRVGDIVFDLTVLKNELAGFEVPGLKKNIASYLTGFLAESKDGKIAQITA